MQQIYKYGLPSSRENTNYMITRKFIVCVRRYLCKVYVYCFKTSLEKIFMIFSYSRNLHLYSLLNTFIYEILLSLPTTGTSRLLSMMSTVLTFVDYKNL